MLLLRNALKGGKGLDVSVDHFLHVSQRYEDAEDTSFGVDSAWIRVIFVSGFTVSIYLPGLAKCLWLGFYQSRIRHEVIALVAVVVSTETTSLSCPSCCELELLIEFISHQHN